MKRILTFLLAITMLFTMFPTATLAGGVDVGTDVVTEQIVTGTISFPEDAYLEGGSLIVDVWARGQITGEYKKAEFEIDSLEDVDFEFLFPANETAVSTRVMLSNLSGAETNLYTDTSSNLDFTLTENGMEDTYEFHYIDIAELATKEILMPCGKMISGTIYGDNLQFVENACLTLVFGNYWSRASIDVETHEYSAVMPYGITEGYYAASVENSSENATSNILNTYGDKEAIYNEAYNDSEDGSELTYSSSNENVATVDKDGKVTIIGAGEATITATAAANDKYLETTASFKLTIKKAVLTVTANDAEIYYGEEGKNNGFTATGFVLGETEAVIKGTPVYEVNYKQFDKAGEYEITVDKLTADNYEITFKPGKLTVKKAEVYNIELSELSQRKGKISEVKTSVTPKDDTAKIKIEYQFTDGVWVDTIPSDIGIGEYKVRAYLTESENLAINVTPKYFESTLEIKAGAVVNLDGNSDLSIDSNVSGDNVEFSIPDEAVEEIVNNVPESGEIVIDATGSTGGVTNLTLPENIITALDESENVNTFTVVADDAEISMSADVLKTVADEMSAGDKVNIHIEAVEKESLNDEQKAALDAIATDAHVLQLNLEVQKQDGTTELHELNGNVEVKAAYTLPADMNGKKIVVCYVSDNGTVTYMRATYKDGFVHFKTDHFSHYAIAAIECTHTWDAGTVITQATTSSEGLKRYECTICGETKDETIPKKSGYVGGGGGTASYTVKFDTNGAGTIKSQTINKNGILTEPTTPTKEGYTFEGWYTDKELTVAYDFATKVTKGFTLYAKWTEIEKDPVVDEPYTTSSFTDVKSDDWFYANVQYVVENKLMNGVAEDKFAPNDTLTRAMLVTVLYRNVGEPATNRSIPFADVDMGSYYANAVSWAKQNGIVSGITENEFAPDANITREQIATIMFRYAQYKGYDVSVGENTNILSYDDFDNISEYAIASMQYACGSGLMKGKTASTLNPKDNATRAEIAAILHRFIDANK